MADGYNVLPLNHTFLTVSICLGGGTPMDENVQQKITLACIALLQKNAADSQQARQCPGRRSPTTKKEAIVLLLKAGSEPDITLANVTDALWIIFKRSKPASQTRQWVTQL